jgi:hypothetical protein
MVNRHTGVVDVEGVEWFGLDDLQMIEGVDSDCEGGR